MNAALSQLARTDRGPACASLGGDGKRWYAVQTRAKHEKKVAADLIFRGLETYLPLIREVHRWSDRRKTLQVPLFPCYAFVQSARIEEMQTIALCHPSVLRMVGAQGRPAAIPDEEMDSIRTVIRSGIPLSPHSLAHAGERVRIRGGSLDGVKGVLVGGCEDSQLVVNVALLGQAVAVSLRNYELEAAA